MPALFTQQMLDDIFPKDRSDRFFEALYGDSADGAYDIRLVYVGEAEDRIRFEFQLQQRPGKCLACNLTYGLPEVFIRHPVIDMTGLVRQIDSRISNGKRCAEWRLGRTREISQTLHALPLTIVLMPGRPE